MRYLSALQVIRCLKEAAGEPLSISEICRRIELSYQPTYAHIRALEQMEVIATDKPRREVKCRLARGAAAQLWLSLASLEEAKQLRKDPQRGPLIQALQAVIEEGVEAAVEVVGVAWPRQQEATRLIVVLSGLQNGATVQRLLQAAHGVVPEIKLDTFAPPAFRQFIAQQGEAIIPTAVPLYGHQRFWELVLTSSAEGAT